MSTNYSKKSVFLTTSGSAQKSHYRNAIEECEREIQNAQKDIDVITEVITKDSLQKEPQKSPLIHVATALSTSSVPAICRKKPVLPNSSGWKQHRHTNTTTTIATTLPTLPVLPCVSTAPPLASVTPVLVTTPTSTLCFVF